MSTYSVLFDPFHTMLDDVLSSFAETMEFYAAGTTTLQDVYTDSTGATPLPNPLTLTAGRETVFGEDGLSYYIVLKNKAGVVLTDIDNYFTTNTLSNATSITSTDPGAGSGPGFELYRNSASPADDDQIGKILFTGKNDAAAKITYGEIATQIVDVTAAGEDGEVILRAMVGGLLTDIITARSFVDIEQDTFFSQGNEPWVYFNRNDPTPVNGDDIGTLFWRGNNAGLTATDYAYMSGKMLDITAGSEDGEIDFNTRVGGSISQKMKVANGVVIGSPTGDYKGSGTLNVGGTIYVNNVVVPTLGANTFVAAQEVISAWGDNANTIIYRDTGNSNNYYIVLNPTSGAGNPIFSADDIKIGGDGGNVDTGIMTIAPWATNVVGVRISAVTDTVEIRGSAVFGAPTGAGKGDGTANFAADIYKNNTAYITPDYALEHYYTGDIVKYIGNEGAKEYKGLPSLEYVEDYTRANFRLPGITGDAMGVFARADFVLEKLEEIYLYLIEHKKRIDTLETA